MISYRVIVLFDVKMSLWTFPCYNIVQLCFMDLLNVHIHVEVLGVRFGIINTQNRCFRWVLSMWMILWRKQKTILFG